ncbi:MAG: iron complex outermembrane recepter protein [Comamonadaceae bacterium]|nr:MAG: iron complex outermembrane recepter protein [Comamonadaceae bacterium]
MYRFTLIFLWVIGLNVTFARAGEAISERDYLDEMPIVLSVSRLPQRLDETPGAVTVLDRDFIRRSGARDVADLLRLVPGFRSSTSFEPDAPQASYHGGFGNYSARIQVLVDGRSVYSTYFFGSVASGLMSVAMEDIERIEVLRGSNSAAYGARAMLGVVNIVTRHTADTLGVQAKLTGGENGVRDAQAAMGWSSDKASYRLSMDTRADDGLTGAYGHNFVRRVNFRSDWAASSEDDVQLRVGTMDIDSGRGFAGVVGNPAHDRFYESSFAQMDLRRTLGVDEDLALTLAHTQERYRDTAPYSLLSLGINDSFNLDVSGSTQNDSITLQHTFRSGTGLRVVWGGEWRREQITSLPVYNTSAALVTDFKRLFTNAEWRITPAFLLNAGVMAEHSSDSGATLAPRLMLNWHLLPGHTMRAGLARAYRPPSSLEKYADIRYSYKGRLLQVNTLARGNIAPESVSVREIGLLSEFPKWGATLDVRAFQEQISGFVRRKQYALPAGTSLLPSNPWDYFNSDDLAIRGFEYQFKSHLWKGAQLGFNQAYAHISFLNPANPAVDPNTAFAVPDLTSTLFFTQKFPGGIELTLTHQDIGTVSLQGSTRDKQALTRTDLRLSKALQWGSKRGELALVIQNMGVPYPDFDRTFMFERRAFLTLRLEY